MTEFLTSTVSFDLFVDNYFTSFRLFACLPTLELANIRARGVLNKNRLHKYTIIMEKQLLQKERDQFEQGSAHQGKTLCNLFDWLGRQQGTLHSFY